MERNFKEADRAIRPWGEVVGRKYITRFTQLQAVPNFRTLGKIQAMKLHRLQGDRKGSWSIHLTDRWRLIAAEGSSEEHVVIQEVSNHYEQ